MVSIGFVAFSLIVYFYLEKTKKARIQRVKRSRGLTIEDEAYNKVERTKGVKKMMKRKGEDTRSADEMVDKAERALEKGQMEQAKSLADKAKNDLSPSNTDMNRSNDDEIKRAYTADELEEVEFKESEVAQQKRKELEEQREKLDSLPENYLESKFELKVARELIDENEADERAKEYYAKAEDSFDKEDYTQALRYSIKCKKSIEGEEGAGLIAGQEIDKNEGPPEEVKEKFSDLLGKQESSSVVAGEEREETVEETTSAKSETTKICPECGFEGSKDDSYCPRCGIELVIETVCPNCGNEVEEGDDFCRNCGASLTESELVCPECGTEVEAEDEFCSSCGIEFE